MGGRGVLLDVARHKGVEHLQDGYPIMVADLDATATAQRVEVRRADFVIVRTGQMEDRLRSLAHIQPPQPLGLHSALA